MSFDEFQSHYCTYDELEKRRFMIKVSASKGDFIAMFFFIQTVIQQDGINI